MPPTFDQDLAISSVGILRLFAMPTLEIVGFGAFAVERLDEFFGPPVMVPVLVLHGLLLSIPICNECAVNTSTERGMDALEERC